MRSPNLEPNKAIVQRYVDEIQNGHSLDSLESIFADDFVDHMTSSGGLFVGGMDGLKRGYATFLNALPDLHVTVEAMIAEGDKVLSRLRFSSGGESWTGVAIQRVIDGKLTETWRLTNRS